MTSTKQSQDKIRDLVEYGLNENEAAIYLYLLTSGANAGATQIAKGADIHRQYVYQSIDKLLEWNLIQESSGDRVKKYKANPPEELEKSAKRRMLAAEDLARELNKISNVGNNQSFEVIQGARAIQQLESDMLRHADKDWECYIIGGATNLYTELMGDLLGKHLAEMRRRKLSVYYLGHESERDLYKKYIGEFENQHYKFLPNLPIGVTHMVIRRETVSFYSFLTPPLVYTIKSETVARNYKDLFMMLWEMGR